MSHTHIVTGHTTIIQGTDRDLNLSLFDDAGDRFTLEASPTEITARFCPESGSTLLERKLTLSEISITNAASGKIKVILPAAFTLTMRQDEHQDFEIEVIQSSVTSVFSFKEALSVESKLVC